jgi:uncharacterized iron-regulated membrane protein
MIDLPDRLGDTIRMVGSMPAGAVGAEPIPLYLFAHPATGALLGWREPGRLGLDHRNYLDIIYGLHVELLAGHVGVWLIGLAALLWMIDHIPAAILAVPRIKGIAVALRVSGSANSLRRLYDLHRAPGLWLLPFTLMLALTGWCLAWAEESRAIIGTLSPVSGRLHYAMPDRETSAHRITAGQALALFTSRHSAPVDSIMPLPRKGLYAIRSFDPRDPDDMGRLWTYLAMEDGRPIARRHDMGSSAGDTFFGWQYPLHSGRAFGLSGRLLVAAVGLATFGLWLSGLLLWRQRGRRKDTIRARATNQVPLT